MVTLCVRSMKRFFKQPGLKNKNFRNRRRKRCVCVCMWRERLGYFFYKLKDFNGTKIAKPLGMIRKSGQGLNYHLDENNSVRPC